MNKKIETKSIAQQKEMATWNVQWEFKDGTPQGLLEGWGNLFEKAGEGQIIDRGGDSLARGSLRDGKKGVKIPILINHSLDQIVGVGVATEEGDAKGNYGIRVRIKLFLDSESETIRTKSLEAWSLCKAGVLNKLSIGFIAHDFEYIDSPSSSSSPSSRSRKISSSKIRLIKDVELLECSMVVVPMNQHSLVESIKAAEEAKKNEVLTILDKSYCTVAEFESAMSDLFQYEEEAWMINKYLEECCGNLSATQVPCINWGMIATDSHLKQYALKLAELMTNNGRAEHAAAQSFFEDFLCKLAPFMAKRRVFNQY